MNYYERAVELKQETVENRRYFHTNAEIGLDMPKAKAYVMQKLKEYGLEPKECGYGVTAELGKGGHGAYPHTSIDPINIGVHVHLALQELMSREVNPEKACVLTVGQFSASTVANIIPETAVLQGTLRTNDKNEREKIVRRIKEVASKTAEVYNGSADVEMITECPPLVCDFKLTDELISYMKELPIPGLAGYPGVTSSASEDFSLIAERVPSVFMYLSSGYLDERGDYSVHNPKVQFNEDVCPMGASCLAHCAQQWLKNNK